MTPSQDASATAGAAALAALGSPPAGGPAHLVTLPRTGQRSTQTLLAFAAVACALGFTLITATRRRSTEP